MARPSTLPLLLDISPESLDRDVHLWALRVLRLNLDFLLGTQSDFIAGGPPESSKTPTVSKIARDLAVFARNGIHPCPHSEMTPRMVDALEGFHVAVLAILAERTTADEGLETRVHVVLEAARGRLALEAGSGVKAAQLAALGSASVRTVFNRVEDGTLTLKKGLITKKSARAWLRSREVAGFCS